jgi:glycosyltransferase involved in cell wall biosynthesis
MHEGMLAMLFTVAICTWNRAGLLEQTLQSFCEVDVPAGLDWELLVVDNCCTDDTEAVVAGYADRLPVRAVRESRAGLSHARNRAVADARGDWIVWTDDDVRVSRGWLRAYADAVHDYPDAGFFGGPIEPWFEEPRPAWLLDGYDAVKTAYGAVDYDRRIVPLTSRRTPHGANFVLRSELARSCPFDTRLGVSPTRRLGGEETRCFDALLARGVSGYWIPAATIRHFVPRKNQTLAFLRNYFAAHGEYRAVLVADGDEPLRFGGIYLAWGKWLVYALRHRIQRLLGLRASRWLKDLCVASEYGAFVRAYRAGPSRQRRPSAR